VKKGLGSGPAAVVGYGKAPDDPDVTTAWPLRSGAVIEAAAILALALRLFQLSRPGYLSGFTQYDDGVYFGDALRLVHGAIAYRADSSSGHSGQGRRNHRRAEHVAPA
jgi:hypothetical protein